MKLKINSISGDRSIILKNNSVAIFWRSAVPYTMEITTCGTNNEQDNQISCSVNWVSRFTTLLDNVNISIPDEYFDEVSEALNDLIEFREYNYQG